MRGSITVKLSVNCRHIRLNLSVRVRCDGPTAVGHRANMERQGERKLTDKASVSYLTFQDHLEDRLTAPGREVTHDRVCEIQSGDAVGEPLHQRDRARGPHAHHGSTRESECEKTPGWVVLGRRSEHHSLAASASLWCRPFMGSQCASARYRRVTRRRSVAIDG